MRAPEDGEGCLSPGVPKQYTVVSIGKFSGGQKAVPASRRGQRFTGTWIQGLDHGGTRAGREHDRQYTLVSIAKCSGKLKGRTPDEPDAAVRSRPPGRSDRSRARREHNRQYTVVSIANFLEWQRRITGTWIQGEEHRQSPPGRGGDKPYTIVFVAKSLGRQKAASCRPLRTARHQQMRRAICPLHYLVDSIWLLRLQPPLLSRGISARRSSFGALVFPRERGYKYRTVRNTDRGLHYEDSPTNC